MIGWLVLVFALLLGAYAVRAGLRANTVDWGHFSINLIDGWVRIYVRRFHGLQADPLPLPKQGGALLASNHLSGLDPLLLVAACDRPLRFLIAQEEYERFGLTWLFRAAGCIPVDRGGRTDAAFRCAVRALKAGEVVALFPHGRIHPDEVGEARVKPGVTRLAQLAEVPIIPARITGVTGVGTVFVCLFKRSRTQVRAFPEISVQQAHAPDLRQHLGELLLGRRAALEND